MGTHIDRLGLDRLRLGGLGVRGDRNGGSGASHDGARAARQNARLETRPFGAESKQCPNQRMRTSGGRSAGPEVEKKGASQFYILSQSTHNSLLLWETWRLKFPRKNSAYTARKHIASAHNEGETVIVCVITSRACLQVRASAQARRLHGSRLKTALQVS